MDKVIFGGNTASDLNADPNANSSELFGDDQAFNSVTSFQSDEILEIDSGLNSPENVGSYRRPEFLKLNSFMIWNDPDQNPQNSQQRQQSIPSPITESSANPSEVPSPVEGVVPGSGNLPENFATANSNSFAAAAESPLNSMNMKTMKKGGLVSRSDTAG